MGSDQFGLSAQKELEGQFLGQVSGTKRHEVSLTIVGPTSAISTRITDACAGLYGAYPFLNLHLRVDDHSDLIELIRRGEADLAVVPTNAVPKEMDSKVLKPDKYILVASSKWKGRKISEIIENERIIDFYESDQTTYKYLSHFGFESRTVRSRIFANDNESLIRLFAGGVGFGTLTESVAKRHLESGEIILLNQGKTLEDHLALVWYPRPAKQEYFEDILRSIK